MQLELFEHQLIEAMVLFYRQGATAELQDSIEQLSRRVKRSRREAIRKIWTRRVWRHLFFIQETKK